jgi:hypothetical protein
MEQAGNLFYNSSGVAMDCAINGAGHQHHSSARLGKTGGWMEQN